MASLDQNEWVDEVLDQYPSGPDAPIRASLLALQRAEGAETVVLVEGISDQIVVETLAHRLGLVDEHAVVVPMGGAQAIANYVNRLGPRGTNQRLAGLCDADAAATFRRGLGKGGLGWSAADDGLEAAGFFVCVEDLEDELIRSLGPEQIEAIIERQGELEFLRRFQRQPAWSGRPIGRQLHRFFGSQSKRHLRYAALMADALPHDQVPEPLQGLLAHVFAGEVSG